MRFSVQLCPHFSNDEMPEELLRYQIVAFDGTMVATELPRPMAERIANHALVAHLTRKEACMFADQYLRDWADEIRTFRCEAVRMDAAIERRVANRRAFEEFKRLRNEAQSQSI